MQLQHERIYLRPLTIKDAPLLLAASQDDEIRYVTATKAIFTLEQIQQHLKIINNDSTRYDFAICLNSNNKMIGELSVFEIDQENKRAGFRISMSSLKLTGKGYGSEALQLTLHLVFNELRLNRLQLEVYSHNANGIAAYKKAGFVTEGVLRESINYNGIYFDELIMSMLKSDYEKLIITKQISSKLI